MTGWRSLRALPRADLAILALLAVLPLLLLAMGEAGGLYPLFHGYFPLASFMRYPVKWFLIASWCLAALAIWLAVARRRPRGRIRGQV